MTKKRSELANSKLLMAACFTILAVGIYANVDGWLMRREFVPEVLGETTQKRVDWGSLWQKIWGRLRYGAKYDQMQEETQKRIEARQELPVDDLIDRELKNIENEYKDDLGEDASSSYWSM